MELIIFTVVNLNLLQNIQGWHDDLKVKLSELLR